MQAGTEDDQDGDGDDHPSLCRERPARCLEHVDAYGDRPDRHNEEDGEVEAEGDLGPDRLREIAVANGDTGPSHRSESASQNRILTQPIDGATTVASSPTERQGIYAIW